MIKLHALKCWFVVDEEGKKEYFFDTPAVAYQERAPEVPKEAQCARVPPVMLELGARIEQITSDEVVNVVMTTNVYDDNAPSPKNFLCPNKQPTNGIFGKWGQYCVCERRRLNGDKTNARINNFP